MMMMMTMTCLDGANMNDALLRSVDLLISQQDSEPLSTRHSMILLITGSNPSVGVTDPTRILAGLRRAAGATQTIPWPTQPTTLGKDVQRCSYRVQVLDL